MSAEPAIAGRRPTLHAAAARGDFLNEMDAQPWMAEALCAQTDPEVWFPEKGGSTRDAKTVCANCSVAAECLDYALDNQERFGIWGGLSERERRKLLKATGQQEEPPIPPTEGTAA